MLAGDGGADLLVLGFESADHPLDAWLDARAGAVPRVRRHDATTPAGRPPRRTRPARGARRSCASPYLRDAAIARRGMIVETFETAMHLGPLRRLHARSPGRPPTRSARRRAAPGRSPCRFTHVYPDGPAPYYSDLGRGRPGATQLAQWDEIKAAAADAIIATGGTITHHHAVGRDHRPWYDRQRPEPFAPALRRGQVGAGPGRHPEPGRARRMNGAPQTGTGRPRWDPFGTTRYARW